MATPTAINIMRSQLSTGTLTVSSTAAAVTAYSSWISQTTLSAGQINVAYPIVGYNFPRSSPSGDSSSSGDTCGAASLSTGIIAGLAVLGVWAVGGTIAATVLAIVSYRARKVAREGQKSPKYEAGPNYVHARPQELVERPAQQAELPADR